MADYMESAPPPPPASYQASVEEPPKKEMHARPDDQGEEPPMKSAKHDENGYAGKSNEEYNTIDFLGNVSGGPHAAAAEALATFSSSVSGENANNANMFVHVPPHNPSAPVSNASHSQAPSTNAPSATPHGPPFLCPTCNTSYSRLEYLRRHERRHADIRPFSCVCGKSFSRSDVLARHKTKCRVVLAGDADGSSERKAERRPSAPRATRARTASQSTRKAGGDEMADLSVDPALSNAVDMSMQPPPPLEGEAPPHGDVEGDSYAFSGGASGYPHASYSAVEGSEHGASGAAKSAAHYASAPPPPGTNSHGVPHRTHDGKVYSQHGGAPASAVRSSSYVSGSAAIHPELSARNAPVYPHSGAHTPTGSNGANSPTSNHASSSPFYAHADAPTHASYLSSNLRESDAAPSSGAPPANAPANNASNAPPYPLGKEPARYSVSSSGPLSPFSNTALSSTMSPYLSAFSCARDIPHSSSPRPSNSGAPTSSAPAAPAATSSAPDAPAPPAPSDGTS